VEERRLVEVGLTLKVRDHPLAAGEHLPRNLGVAPLVRLEEVERQTRIEKHPRNDQEQQDGPRPDLNRLGDRTREKYTGQEKRNPREEVAGQWQGWRGGGKLLRENRRVHHLVFLTRRGRGKSGRSCQMRREESMSLPFQKNSCQILVRSGKVETGRVNRG